MTETPTPNFHVFHRLGDDDDQSTWTLCSIHKPGNGYWFCHDTEQAARFAVQRIQEDPFYIAWDLYCGTRHVEGHGVDMFADLTHRLSIMLSTANNKVIQSTNRVVDAAMQEVCPPTHKENLLALVEDSRWNAQWWLTRLVDAHRWAVVDGLYEAENKNWGASGADIIKQAHEVHKAFEREGRPDSASGNSLGT